MLRAMRFLLTRLLLIGGASLVAGGLAGYVTRPVVTTGNLPGSSDTMRKPEAASAEARQATGATNDGVVSAEMRWCQQLSEAGIDRVEEFLKAAALDPDPLRQRAMQEVVVEHMTRMDPLGTWAVLEKMKLESLRPLFLGAWARADAAAAVDWVETQGAETQNLMKNLVDGLLPDDLAALATIWPRLAPGSVTDAAAAGLFRRLAATDPGTARALLAGMPAGTSRNVGTSAFAEGWAREQTEAAYAWAKDLEDPAERESALRGVLRAWAEKDPQTVAARMDELAKDELRDKNGQPLAQGESPVRAVVRAWAAQDPLAAAAWLRQRPSEGRDEFRELFSKEILPLRADWSVAEISEMMRRPGEKDVSDMADKLFQGASSTGYGDRSFSVSGPWGMDSPLGSEHFLGGPPPVRFEDPGAAYTELTHQPPDATRQHLLQEVARQWAEKDPQAASERLQQTKDPLLSLSLTNALASLAKNTLNLELVQDIAAAHPEAALRSFVGVNDVYEELVRREPERAQALLETDLSDFQRSQLVQRLVSDRASYDPEGAVAWAQQQPNDDLRNSALTNAVRTWAGADAYAASEWLAAQPPGTARDPAVRALVDVLSESSPDEALAWAAAISDAEARDQEAGNVIRRMIWRDPERARELLESAAVSDRLRQDLTKRLERRQSR